MVPVGVTSALIDRGRRKRVLQQRGKGLRGEQRMAGKIRLCSQEGRCFLASGPCLRSWESGMNSTKNSFSLGTGVEEST